MGVLLRSAITAIVIGVSTSLAAQSFVVNRIDVQGLQRVSLGNVLSELSIRDGDLIDEADASEWIHQIYDLGYFYSVDVSRENDDLVIDVVERPAIENVDFTGNDSFPTDSLEGVFADVGLSQGEIFSQSLLENIQLELEKQYGSQGRYNAQVEAVLTPLTRNRVDIELVITEGPVAKIKHLEFVGNDVFDDIELYDVVDIRTSDTIAFWKFLSKKDQFSTAALIGDVQRLEDFYFDRGYLDFKIESQQVSISENKADISIALNVSEGSAYQISAVEIAGDLKHLSDDINALNTLQTGQTYSRADVQNIVSQMTTLAGEYGYAFANIRDYQVADADTHTVKVFFQVQLGLPVYVNRIIIQGNSSTNDEVIRRELRQLERALLINDKLKLSKSRLERLGYFKTVSVRTQKVTGRDDLVDIIVDVEEAKDSQINISGGYSQSSGMFASLALTQSNFAGAGVDFSAAVTVDEDTKNYTLSVENPYFTLEGVSLGLDLFYENTDYSDSSSTIYATDSIGGVVTVGYPLSENQRVSYGLGAKHDSLYLDDELAFQEMADFAGEFGSEYDVITGEFGWVYNTLNGTIKADDGAKVSSSLEVATVPGDLEYYRVKLAAQKYFNIEDNLAFRVHTDLGYGNGYGANQSLPFFENYFAGGASSVRGFEYGSLGPKGTPQLDTDGEEMTTPTAVGGNIKIEYGAELLIPTPFVKDQSAFRTSLFLDAGNVFTSNCSAGSAYCSEGIDFSEIRYSVGVDVTWITIFAPLSFSYGIPLNARSGDNIQNFAFNIGISF